MNGTNSSKKHYDMVVIGSGAAGHHGAIQAAKLGKKVAVVERSVALGEPVSTPAQFRVRHFGRLSCVLPDQDARIAGSRSQTWHRESRRSRPTKFGSLRISFAAMISMY